MSLLSRLLTPPSRPLGRLWAWVVATARQPRWYLRHRVADSIDGRFDMVVLVTSLVLLELEARGRHREAAVLTERFVEDMEGSIREIGIGDLVVGKHMGRMIGALGGRLGGYRRALSEAADDAELAAMLERNLYRGAVPEGADLGELALAVRTLAALLRRAGDEALLTGAVEGAAEETGG